MAQNRKTKQRTVILDVLRGVKTHPTADQIYDMVRKKMPRVSLGTVYRNLDVLTSLGEITRLDKAGSQKRFDGDTRPHFHVRCQICGKVGDILKDIVVPSISDIEIDSFTLTKVDVEFSGICNECGNTETPLQ